MTCYNKNMKKIQYYDLQKKYEGKLVALNKKETKILAVAHRADQLVEKVKKQHIPISNIIVMGPIQRSGAIIVYFSVSP